MSEAHHITISRIFSEVHVFSDCKSRNTLSTFWQRSYATKMSFFVACLAIIAMQYRIYSLSIGSVIQTIKPLLSHYMTPCLSGSFCHRHVRENSLLSWGPVEGVTCTITAGLQCQSSLFHTLKLPMGQFFSRHLTACVDGVILVEITFQLELLIIVEWSKMLQKLTVFNKSPSSAKWLFFGREKFCSSNKSSFQY